MVFYVEGSFIARFGCCMRFVFTNRDMYIFFSIHVIVILKFLPKYNLRAGLKHQSHQVVYSSFPAGICQWIWWLTHYTQISILSRWSCLWVGVRGVLMLCVASRWIKKCRSIAGIQQSKFVWKVIYHTLVNIAIKEECTSYSNWNNRTNIVRPH